MDNILQGLQANPLEIQNTDVIKRRLSELQEAIDVLQVEVDAIESSGGGGSGDVSGGSSSVDENITVFDGTTGKLIKDSGVNLSDLNTLTDNSNADALHDHSQLVASDGSPDPALSVDASGNVGIGRIPLVHKLEVEGTVQTSSIKFPATQSPSSDVNTLDDYEEGTWTPTISFDGASTGITYDIHRGKYTKIGNTVNLSCYIVLTSKGSSVGYAIINNLPFTVMNDVGAFSAVNLWFTGITFTGQINGYTTVNANRIELLQTTETGTHLRLTDVNFSNTSEMIISATYFTN